MLATKVTYTAYKPAETSSSSRNCSKRQHHTETVILARPCPSIRITETKRTYKAYSKVPIQKHQSYQALPPRTVNTTLDTDSPAQLEVLFNELLSTIGTSVQELQGPEPDSNTTADLPATVPVHPDAELFEMALKRSKPALRIKSRPRSMFTPLALMTPGTPPSPEDLHLHQIPQRVVGPINIAIIRYLANIPFHSKENSRQYSIDPMLLSPRSNASSSSDSEDITPAQSPTSEATNRWSSSSSISSITSTPSQGSLATVLLEKLAGAQTFLAYIQSLFKLYHSSILPSIRTHYNTLYTTWCHAIDTASDADTDPTVIALEKEMELLVDWAVPGMGNAIELAQKRWSEEERWVGLRDEGKWETPSGARGEGRIFKHLADRFAGLQAEGGEVLIRMAREKLCGRGWEM
ncbi:hypothetical protein BJ508DRAFT_326027 [Ascobolus immersus RN42]|uniref:Uncharacterized protein n=1 Tax=Ascobolus immersus RN42 TaxID=1160509 RepID=A0A3N4I7F9_ASCIM|nr:hypothetical protein BJ508DRAFT_326027 [Ascobolus immersus RN42]